MSTPTFPDGFHCSHGYPPGECCPACGEIPDPMAGMWLDEHDADCQCFACEEALPSGEKKPQ